MRVSAIAVHSGLRKTPDRGPSENEKKRKKRAKLVRA
jgi:hypothetical protein